jgi:hypothetical protein
VDRGVHSEVASGAPITGEIHPTLKHDSWHTVAEIEPADRHVTTAGRRTTLPCRDPTFNP